MSIARLQAAVGAAERELTASRAVLDAQQHALRHRVTDVWVPRALVVGGAAAGFWIEGRLRRPHGAEHVEAEREQAAESVAESAPSVAGLAVWLAMAESMLRLMNQLKPLLATRHDAHDNTSAAPSTSGKAAPVEDEMSAQAASKGADVDAWR